MIDRSFTDDFSGTTNIQKALESEYEDSASDKGDGECAAAKSEDVIVAETVQPNPMKNLTSLRSKS